MALLVLMLLVAFAGCGGDAERPAAREAPGRSGDGPSVAPPDAGVAHGHGADPRRVRVPRVDRTAPVAVVRLGRASAVSDGPAPSVVRLGEPLLEPAATGRDEQGVGRVRLRVNARIRCGDSVLPVALGVATGASLAPGALAPVERTRRARFDLAAERCLDDRVTAADGTLRAHAVSARGGPGDSAAIRFLYRP